ncbi:MAG: polysaccharide pyruvyl transferase family protein [Bacteroidaceae bacterium]|nr:polysaccharide pyruvyl transferase family protein [Bacteroidaceae bacterium]
MKFVLSGVETRNKGAELMLYAILQEIERKYPTADIFIPEINVRQGKYYLKTTLNINLIPADSSFKMHCRGLLKRFNMSWPSCLYPTKIKGADYFFDGSGLLFSDKMLKREYDIMFWNNLKKYKAQQTKIVFLPQAFGPVAKKLTQDGIKLISKYADLIMPREEVSYNYVKQVGIDMANVKKFSDFTSLVEGIFPDKYEHLRNGVCIVPNKQMIRQGIMTFEDYIQMMTSMVDIIEEKGFKPYLLNHEGKEDAELMLKIKEHMKREIETVTDLNALEVKGLIGSSYLCITSRFHGVANAMNACVPCLATSWSHKYAELFKDYGQSDCVLDLKDPDKRNKKIVEFLETERNQEIRKNIAVYVPKIKSQTQMMWDTIWNL